MTIENLTCIRCPLGCALEVQVEDGKILKVEGYSCKRGLDYAEKEVLNPTRTLTSTLPLIGGAVAMCPIKTSSDVPKGKLGDCLAILQNATVTAPVQVGQILVENIADTGANIVATRAISVR